MSSSTSPEPPLSLTLGRATIAFEQLGSIADTAVTSVWGACRPSENATERTEQWSVSRETGVTLSVDGVAVAQGRDDWDVAPMIEQRIYQHILAWYAPWLSIHAALLSWNGRTALLVGASGSGKSTLSMRACRDGFGYLTDELTLIDGARIFGVPRAIQLDATRNPASLPAHLSGLDIESYRARLSDGHIWTRPLLPLAEVTIDRASYRVSDVTVFELVGVGEPLVEPVTPVDTLRALYENIRGEPKFSLGGLLGRGRGYRLRWNDPEQAVDAIRSRLERAGG